MKVLLIYNDEDKAAAGRINIFLEKEKILIEDFDHEEQDGEGISKIASLLFRKGFGETDRDLPDIPTHVLIISPLPRFWFDFLAGFSCGSSVPVLVCGEAAIAAIPKQVAFSYMSFLTEESLQKYIENEVEAYKRQDEARKIINAQETLLRKGIPLTREALAKCAEEGGLEDMSLFLAAGFSTDTRNMAGVTLLNIAARKGNKAALVFLIQSGANLNLLSQDRGSTALVDGVMGNKDEIANELIEAGADLNLKTKNGQTALVIAVGAGNAAMVEALLKAGADPDISDSMGTSARKYANLFHKAEITALFDKYAPKKEV